MAKLKLVHRLTVVWFVAPAALLVAPAKPLVGLTPKSPEVRQAVAKGVRFLESLEAEDPRMGAKALIGLAILKSGADRNHPRVVEAVAAIKDEIRPNADPASLEYDKLYAPAIACIFMIEVDPEGLAPEINTLLKYLQHTQKANGGWGYPPGHKHALTSDTSMTQYGVLCAWEATRAGFELPMSVAERGLIWLLKTQDPSGGWGYQGITSNSFAPVRQDHVTPSLSAAGLGSVYACADLLGLRTPNKKNGLPPALVAVGTPGSRQPVARIDPKLVHEVQTRGNDWMRLNYTVNPAEWTYYYLYALERYHSFREAAEENVTAESTWYNDGARFLMSQQSPRGYWEQDYQALAGRPISTAFAVLFLVRSMQKSIEKTRSYGDGTLVGGRGLPSDTDAVFVRHGQVMPLPQVAAIDRLLATVDDTSDADDFLTIEALVVMPEEVATPLINKHAEKLRQLAGAGSPEARLAAVSALAQARNMDDVPVMIYALTDPNPAVVREARDGLRRISRKFDGFDLPDRFTEGDRRAAITRWKQWYLTVRPDAEFQD